MFKQNNLPKIILWLILLIGAVIRFYHYNTFSLTSDEASALSRLRFHSFHALIQHGVRIDGHPAGVQVFLYYWTMLFGNSEASVRFMFVVAGIFSIWFAWRIAERWFGKTSGLLVAASIAFLQFPLLYSRIARPYAPGLLFSLMMVWFWTSYLFDKNKTDENTASEDRKKQKNRALTGYVIASSLCMYTHYFSFLMAVIVGISGLFFLKKDNWKPYLLAGIAIVALYLPYMKVFLYQLSLGGVGGKGGWLGIPHPAFFFDYIYYGFNNSAVLTGILILFLIVPLILHLKKIRWTKFHSLTLIWFLLPFFIGYVYSVHVDPVLQYSTLLFSFPFLLFFVFSFMPDLKTDWKNIVLILLFTGYGVFNTVGENNFYQSHHFGVLKELASHIKKWDNQYGKENITHTANVAAPFYINYYLNRYHVKDSFATYRNQGGDSLYKFQQLVDTCKTPYLLYAWSTVNSPLEIPEIIQAKYPHLVERHYYYDSEIYLFSKTSKSAQQDSDIIFQSNNDFEGAVKNWSANLNTYTDSVVFSGQKAAKLGGASEYGPTFRMRLGDMVHSRNNIINVNVMAWFKTADAKAQLVIAFSNKGKTESWNGMPLEHFVKTSGKWQEAFFSIRIPQQVNSPDDIVTIYVWDNSKKPMYIDNMHIKVTKGNPIIYGAPTPL